MTVEPEFRPTKSSLNPVFFFMPGYLRLGTLVFGLDSSCKGGQALLCIVGYLAAFLASPHWVTCSAPSPPGVTAGSTPGCCWELLGGSVAPYCARTQSFCYSAGWFLFKFFSVLDDELLEDKRSSLPFFSTKLLPCSHASFPLWG